MRGVRPLHDGDGFDEQSRQLHHRVGRQPRTATGRSSRTPSTAACRRWRTLTLIRELQAELDGSRLLEARRGLVVRAYRQVWIELRIPQLIEIRWGDPLLVVTLSNPEILLIHIERRVLICRVEDICD